MASLHPRRLFAELFIHNPPEARAKARTQRAAAGEPVHIFQTLLADLATIVKNRIQPHGGGEPLDMLTRPTELQRKALELLGVSLTCTQ